MTQMTKKHPIRMAENIPQWKGGNYTTVTFCVTEDCNLACDYCYMLNKNNKRKMTFETAKKIVDFVLTNPIGSFNDSVGWDFIGGEPLLEMELIDKISDYILAKTYAIKHPWFQNHSFTFSTNGTLYGEPLVRKYIKKHHGHCWFGMSVDGTKEKHDRARKYKDGRGSYDDVVKNVPLWLSEFPQAATKSTFASEDLPYLKDSIINLWNLGIHDVMANIVFEDVWKKDDTQIFETQLQELADYIIENDLWDKYRVAFFDVGSGLPVGRKEMEKSRCGACRKMIAFDCEGDAYPCVRFLDMCFPDKSKITIGNIEKGIDKDRVRAFASLSWRAQSPDKCNDCFCGSNCGWCEAFNFQDSPNDTIYERSTYICEMNKVNAKVNDYLWQRYAEVTGKTSPRAEYKAAKTDLSARRFVLFLASDDTTPHCSYTVPGNKTARMSQDVLEAGLKYCHSHDLIPVFLGKLEHGLNKEDNTFFEIIDISKHCGDIQCPQPFATDTIEILRPGYDISGSGIIANYIVRRDKFGQICSDLEKFFEKKSRINLFAEDLAEWGLPDIQAYQMVLADIRCLLAKLWAAGRKVQLNIINDMFKKDITSECGAGVSIITLAPNGKFYICPGFYFYNEDDNVGDIEHGVNEGKVRLCHRKFSPQCQECTVNCCNRCLLANKIRTREIHIPGEAQCKMQIANCEASLCFRADLLALGLFGQDTAAFEVPEYNDSLTWTN